MRIEIEYNFNEDTERKFNDRIFDDLALRVAYPQELTTAHRILAEELYIGLNTQLIDILSEIR